MMNEGDERPGSPEKLTEEVEAELARAEVADDEARLTTLEEVHRRLENELEGDPDQAGAPRR